MGFIVVVIFFLSVTDAGYVETFKNFKYSNLNAAATSSAADFLQHGPIKKHAPVVETTNGLVQGKLLISRNLLKYYAYTKIPFAVPPLEELRFKDPKPFEERWEGIREAQTFGPMCAQFDAAVLGKPAGEEDCLYLAVYTSDVKPQNLKSVLVFFHGGAFQTGRINEYGAKYLIDEDIVIVIPAYRLGPLGFLNNGDGVIKGNQGLKDQTMALRWIKKNIKNFGGNPNDVTIAGQSAGGGSVHLHIVSPLSKGLFHKAISLSGSAFSSWAVNKNPEKLATEFKEKIGCNVGNVDDQLHCLKKANITKILLANSDYMTATETYSMSNNWASSIEKDKEGAFLTQHPETSYKNGDINKVPFVAGSCVWDGNIFGARLDASPKLKESLPYKIREILPYLLDYDPANDKNTNVIMEHFFKEPLEKLKNDTTPVVKLTGDYYFQFPTQKGLELHRQYAPTFMYQYTYNKGLTFYSGFSAYSAEEKDKKMRLIKAAGDFVAGKMGTMLEHEFGYKNDWGAGNQWKPGHSDDLFMIFYFGFRITEISQVDEMYPLSKMMTSYIANFMKSPAKNLTEIQFGGISWPSLHTLKDNELKVMLLNTLPSLENESPYQSSTDVFRKLGY